jgi:hypothetical protein
MILPWVCLWKYLEWHFCLTHSFQAHRLSLCPWSHYSLTQLQLFEQFLNTALNSQQLSPRLAHGRLPHSKQFMLKCHFWEELLSYILIYNGALHLSNSELFYLSISFLRAVVRKYKIILITHLLIYTMGDS